MRKFKSRERLPACKNCRVGKRLARHRLDAPALQRAQAEQAVLCADHKPVQPLVRRQNIRARAEDPRLHTAMRRGTKQRGKLVFIFGKCHQRRRPADAERRMGAERLIFCKRRVRAHRPQQL